MPFNRRYEDNDREKSLCAKNFKDKISKRNGWAKSGLRAIFGGVRQIGVKLDGCLE
jgi:hypothetical protein